MMPCVEIDWHVFLRVNGGVAALKLMALVGPLGGWRLDVPQIERDGTGVFKGMLSRNGGSRIVVSGIELMTFEVKGPIAVAGPFASD